MTGSRLVIVSGVPASGKTTLAERLAAELGCVLLTKDLIKESLFDSLGSPDRERSRQLSLAAYTVLYRVAARLIDGGTHFVLESNFQRGVSEPELLPLVRRASAILIHCAASPRALARRFDRRAASPLRHAGHHDESLTPDELRRLTRGIDDPIDLPIPLLRVDTTDGYVPGFSDILDFARKAGGQPHVVSFVL